MPAWGLVAGAAAKLAASPAGRKVAQEAGGAVAGAVSKASAATVGKAQAARKQRALAHKLARQVHGHLSEAVFIGSDREHLVVWKDGVPLAAFPPVDGALAQRSELAHVTDADRFEPPPPKARSDTGSTRRRVPQLLGAISRRLPNRS